MKTLKCVYSGVENVTYDVKHSEDEVILHYGTDRSWTKPGAKAYSLINTGKGYRFKDHFTGKKMDIDYCQVGALIALLKLSGQEKHHFKVMEEVDEFHF